MQEADFQSKEGQQKLINALFYSLQVKPFRGKLGAHLWTKKRRI